ncbi:unnamed protein product [Allacma fusca]|uniref:Major facilitator superfamily (MFS) profile domain-containing protein n=1 Tax=Allacma fusca TaxID=39272 RepID=A0A8J2KBI0_9HEXA|nr:unnamed protein product [Allacma fusca]
MGVENLEIEESISVEDALQKLGGFSRFQLFITFIVLLSEIPVAANVLTLIFTGTSNVEFKCMRNNTDFEFISAHDPRICSRNCTLVLDPMEPVLSIVQEWELICERAWLPDFLTSIQMLGMIIGALSGSQIADAFGRKTAFYSNVAVMGAFGLVSGVANNIYLFGGSRFLAGVGLGGFYCVYYIFLMEFLTPKWRTIAGCVSIWSVGIMSLALLAYLLPSWRYLTCAPSIVALVVLCFYPFVPETPRWLLCKERTVEAEKCFRQIAKMNGRPELEASVIDSLQKTVMRERSDETSPRACSWEIFRNPSLRSKLFLFVFGWYTLSFVYYSMCFNTKNLSGDPYLNVFYMGLVDLTAWPSGVFLNNWIGRRKTYAGYLVFATIFLATLVIIDHVAGRAGQEHLISIVSYFGRFGIGGAWGVVTCFTAESFPTTCRSTSMGMCAFFAYVGGVAAPQMAYIGTVHPRIPHFLFAGLTLAAAMSTFLLKETNKKPLENFASH